VARAAEREVVCRVSRRDDDGAGDGGSEARRMIEGEHGTAAASWARRPAVGEASVS
jgi:hypothetical protein